jgi:hypothetical protein
MPAVVVPVATWIAGTVSVAGAAVGITGAAGAWLTVAAYTVSEIALYAGMSYAVDAATRPKLKPAGSEITFNMDPAYPREMIIGQRLVGGSMVARYSRGSNLYNAHLVIQVADHPCVELSKVYDGGRVVQATPLTHGSRTEITAYSASGGARVWMTWHDGRPGQTADSDLVTKSAQDPEVVSGKIPGWSNDHVGAGCAYIHVEVQWDSDILTSIPQFTFLVKGAKLYDRRLDTTAGGSGDHRLDDPSTWEYSTNAAVAADHYLLGYKVEDDDLAFGIGLHPSEVPYEIFAHAADLADEDVETGTGDDVETIKRYAANGVISTADYFEEVLEAFQVQMAARFVDLGGRIGILGAEERDISLDLSDMDLVSDEQMQFADKLPFSDLYGSVGGTYADPANLYQQTPYDTLTTAYNALPDGGEAQQAQLPLPFEIHPRRAVRLASAWINRESLQPRLVGVFMAVAWALEPGDWFTFSSERLALTEAKFEVIDIAKRDDFTVTITARAIDPDFLAFSVDDDPEIGTPPEIDPFELLLDAPAFTPTATTISGGGATEPVIQVVLDALNPVTREIVIEAQEWNGSALTGPMLFFTGHADNLTSILRQGLKPATAYKVRTKARSGDRESSWSEWSSAITLSSTYIVPAAGSASGDLADDLADIASDIAAADARLDDAEDELDLQGTDIGTLQTLTASQATLITGLQASTLNPKPNLVPDGGLTRGAEGWTLGDYDHIRYDADEGDMVYVTGAGTHYATSPAFDVTQGQPYSVRFRAAGNGITAGSTAVYIQWCDASGTGLSYSSGRTINNAAGFENFALENQIAPGGSVAKARIFLQTVIPTSGTAWFGRFKCNHGATAMAFSDETTSVSFDASIIEVESVNADQDSAIATIDSRMDVAETDIDGVQSTASNLSTRMTAVDGGSATSTSIAQLVAKTNANQNLIKNSTGASGADNWQLPSGWVSDHLGLWGNWFTKLYTGASGVTEFVTSDTFPLLAGQAYTLSAVPYIAGRTAGSVTLYAVWYNGATYVGEGGHIVLSANDQTRTRRSATFTVPSSGVTHLRFALAVTSFSGDAGYAQVGFWQAKIEQGSTATVWSDDATADSTMARVTTAEEAIADEVSARAAAISSVEAEVGDVEADVTVIQSALASPDGSTALIAMEADADGVITGFKLISVASGHSTPISIIELTAALTIIHGDAIVDGTLTADKIVTDGITEFDVVTTTASLDFTSMPDATWVDFVTAAGVVVPADTKVVLDFSFIIGWAGTSGAGEIQMRLRRDSTTIESWTDISTLDVDNPGVRQTVPFASSETDVPGAGTYTYKLQVMMDELGSIDPAGGLREGKFKVSQFYR